MADQSNDQKMQELYMELQLLDKQLKKMQERHMMLAQQIMEMRASSQSLDEISSVKEGSQILVPISGGIFAKATIAKVDSLIVNVGADTCVTKDVASTKKLMDSQREDAQKVQQALMHQMEKLSAHAEQLQEQLQALLPAH